MKQNFNTPEFEYFKSTHRHHCVIVDVYNFILYKIECHRDAETLEIISSIDEYEAEYNSISSRLCEPPFKQFDKKLKAFSLNSDCYKKVKYEDIKWMVDIIQQTHNI